MACLPPKQNSDLFSPTQHRLPPPAIKWPYYLFIIIDKPKYLRKINLLSSKIFIESTKLEALLGVRDTRNKIDKMHPGRKEINNNKEGSADEKN